MVPFSGKSTVQDSFLPGGKITTTSPYHSTSRNAAVYVRGLVSMAVAAFVGLLLWRLGTSTTELLRSSSSSANEPVVDPVMEYLRGDFIASLKSSLQLTLEATVKETVKNEVHEVVQGEVKALAKIASDGQAELQSFKLSEAGLAATRSKLAGEDEASKKRLEAFNYIFDNNVWTSAESKSGPGSEVDESGELSA